MQLSILKTQEIVIVSDLWGIKGDWFAEYEAILSDHYQLSFINACSLAEINVEDYSEDKIHQQFVNGGIDLAVTKLLKQEPTNKIYLGCSIGGVILWKAALQGFQMEKLITISSTRLRYETARPANLHKMYFGKNDTNIPNPTWINSIGTEYVVMVDGDHEIYKDKSIISEVLASMK